MVLHSKFALFLGLFSLVTALKNGGVARTPVMGYNGECSACVRRTHRDYYRATAWNAFQCNINEDLFMTTAEYMVSLGLKDAGYEYINLDDCYASKSRTENGTIVEGEGKSLLQTYTVLT